MAASTSGEFQLPSSWLDSAKYYFSNRRSTVEEAERSLVTRGLKSAGIPLVAAGEETAAPSADGWLARLRKQRLSGKDPRRELNLLEISRPATAKSDHAVIVLPGYGNALGFWWQNMAAMALPGLRLLFVDPLGTGLSGRPSFPSIKVRSAHPASSDQRSRSRPLARPRRFANALPRPKTSLSTR